MPYLMVCNVETPPAAGEPCPPEAIQYYQNFWDTGMTLEQTMELTGLVVVLWVTAYVFTQVKRMF